MKKIYFLAIMLVGSIFMNKLTAQSTPETKPVVASPPIETAEIDEIFEKVEIEASVNVAHWRRNLETKLIPYIEKAAVSGMKAGHHTVNVRFLVERDGSISDVKALNDPGYGLAQGAVRVVRTGPRWTPGEINGKKVRSYHTQPITFVIQEEAK
ncbi:MAG TPA: energy transducer TonB, partial [Flavisolibacter sp.]|nr:energy transducer TonB [Flavisolibacter sp.]